MLKRVILKLLYFILTIKLSFSQFYNVNFLKLGYNKGLNSVNIKSIVKDKFGFVWVGTQDGLYKFVGNTFIQIQDHSAGSIFGNDVTCLELDERNNMLWVAFSYGGIHGIDLTTNTIKHSVRVNDFSESISSWIKALKPVSKNEILVGTNNGLFLYNLATNHFTNFRIDFPSLPKDTTNPVSALVKVSFTTYIAFVENKGIVEINLLKHNQLNYYTFKNIFHKEIEVITHVFYDSKSNSCWLSSYSGLYLLRLNELKSVQSDTNPMYKEARALFQQVTYCVQTDDSNNLWICNREGVFKFDLNTYKIVAVRSGENQIESKWETAGNAIKIFGNEVWVGTWTGLYTASIRQSPFDAVYFDAKTRVRLEHVYHTFCFNGSSIYICGEKGLYKYSPDGSRLQIVDEKNYYSYIYNTTDQTYLISRLDGLFFSKNMSLTKLIPAESKSPEFEEVKDFVIGSSTVRNNGIVVFGSDNGKGIMAWNKKEKKIVQINSKSENLRLKEDIVNGVFNDRNNNTLILGDDYISIIDSAFATVTSKKIVNATAKWNYHLFFDVVQIGSFYYIATYGHGILITNKSLDIVKILDVNTGLSNNSVYQLIVQGDIVWASTNYGINRIDTKTDSVSKYFKEDGIHSNICEEYSSMHIGNKIIFGGVYGFTIIEPDRISINTIAPTLHFNNIQIDESVNGLVKKYNLTNLELEKYTISNRWLAANISFAGLNYTNPDRVTYQYRLVENDTSWINIGTQNFVNLIGLDPGSYTLQVKACNEDGYWSPVKQLLLTFQPKWYQTWWFYTLLIITIITILYAFFRYRINQIRKQHQIRKDIANDLHDDIGSTLNTVKIFTHLAKREQDKESYLNEIETSLTNATTGLRDMLWVLDDSQDTAFELVERVRKFVLPVLEANNIRLDARLETDGHKALSKAEKRNLYLIAKESINNSIKYSACKNIFLHVNQANGKTTVLIQDDGEGFNTNKLSEGNGLKNIRERAKQIHYLVDIISSPGNGTTIKLVKK